METIKQLVRKDLKANMEEIFLRNILKEPTHGYKLLTDFREKYGVLFSPSEIYPLLHTLEEKGYVSSKKGHLDNEKPRRVYHAVPFKTSRRLKEIITIKNLNRMIMNRIPTRSLSVRLPELPDMRA